MSRDPVCVRRPSRAALHLLCTAQPPPPLSPAKTFQISLLSGAVAGFTVDAVLFPLDTLKTRMQLATPSPSQAASFGPLIKSLYAGFGPAVAASAPAAAAFFAVYDYTKRILSQTELGQRFVPLAHMLAAAAGDVSSSTVRVPFEVVKQRIQSGQYATARAAIKGTMASQGVPGFFSGYGSLLLRELPFDALQFPLYEAFKSNWAKRTGVNELPTWQNSVCGSMAGAISATVTTPLDVVKTRLMTQVGAVPKYHGIVHGLKTIAREEGPAALMSGVAPRVLWISMGGAVFFGAYEAARKSLYPKFLAKAQQREQEKNSKVR